MDSSYRVLAESDRGGAKQGPADVHMRNVKGLALFLLALLAGYIMYRVLGCRAAGWECNTKDVVQHYEDVTTMFAIGGVVFATGPACDQRTLGRAAIVFVCTIWAFGAIGQIPWMQNSLADSSILAPPSIYLYGPAAVLVLLIALYALIMGCRSKHDAGITAAVLVAIIAVYGIAAAIAVVPALHKGSGSDDAAVSGPISFHVHHYSLAWNLTLLFRSEDDPPTALIRWMLLGVFVQGMSAYGPAGILQEPGGSSNLVGV